jgi:hypothetical protein
MIVHYYVHGTNVYLVNFFLINCSLHTLYHHYINILHNSWIGSSQLTYITFSISVSAILLWWFYHSWPFYLVVSVIQCLLWYKMYLWAKLKQTGMVHFRNCIQHQRWLLSLKIDISQNNNPTEFILDFANARFPYF